MIQQETRGVFRRDGDGRRGVVAAERPAASLARLLMLLAMVSRFEIERRGWAGGGSST